jgi:5-methylcytosine-specific restriction endonuclease McrA
MGAKRPRLAQKRALRHARRMAQEGVRCCLCGHGFNLELSHGHPGQLSADHIIPVREGGSDDADNIRPMHVVCNQLLDRWSQGLISWRDRARGAGAPGALLQGAAFPFTQTGSHAGQAPP